MDPMVIDTDAPPQSKSDADLALYLATSNTNTSGPGLLPWNTADNDYGFGHNTLGLYDASDDLGYSWSEEEANRYIVANHPLVEHETELSDHSYTTDSGSRNSSNQYSDPSFINHTENGYHGERAWHNFPMYDSQSRETLLPPLRMGSPRPSGILLPDGHFSMYLPPPTPRARFLGSSGPNVLPHPHSSPQDTELLIPPLRDLLVDHPSPLSSTSSPHPPSSLEGQYVSPEEINAAYGSPKDDMAHTDHEATSSSDETPIKCSMRLPRLGNGKSTRGGKGGARGGRRNGSIGPRRNSDTKDPPPSTESRSKRRRPSYSSSSDASVASQASVPLHKRPKRKATSKAVATSTDSDSDGDSGDAYLPSRSPSPYASPSDGARSPSPSPEYSQHKSKKRSTTNATDASKLSAAEALAQIAAEKAKLENGDNEDYQPFHNFETGKRKNGTIPLPVPVPHLTKKSRGRKVPYADARPARPRSIEDEPGPSAGGSRGSPAKRGRGGRRGAGGARSFVCVVPGCGKCFVRGEHLKRHVRSIHTHDKPHQCPYDGCDKSFSRRDNLGQHVRLHLMDSL